jgi:transcriptional regulator with XRE-family HTH domain
MIRSLFEVFPERLTQFRKSKNLSQQQLAGLVGVHVAQIRRYEYGQSQPTLDVLRKLAVSLGVTGDELLFDTKERGADQELSLQFEAVQRMDGEDRKHVKAVLDGLILRHQAKVLAKTS